jgi:hypothetical protein
MPERLRMDRLGIFLDSNNIDGCCYYYFRLCRAERPEYHLRLLWNSSSRVITMQRSLHFQSTFFHNMLYNIFFMLEVVVVFYNLRGF